MFIRLAQRVLNWIMREELEKLREEARSSHEQISEFGVALRGLDQVVSKMEGMEGSYRFQEHYQLWRITNSGGWRHD